MPDMGRVPTLERKIKMTSEKLKTDVVMKCYLEPLLRVMYDNFLGLNYRLTDRGEEVIIATKDNKRVAVNVNDLALHTAIKVVMAEAEKLK